MVSIPLALLSLRKGLFQWRDIDRNASLIRQQSEVLRQLLQNTRKPLDPILVLPSTDEEAAFWVVDGHLRVKAYRMLRWSGDIPVMILRGSVREAKAAGLSANIHSSKIRARPKLPSDRHECVEAAWRLIKADHGSVDGTYTRREIIRLTTVSDQTLGRMKRTLEAYGDAVIGLSWAEVLTLRSTMDREADPEWQLRQAKRILSVLRRKPVAQYSKDPEILAMALQMMDGSFPEAVKASLAGQQNAPPIPSGTIRASRAATG